MSSCGLRFQDFRYDMVHWGFEKYPGFLSPAEKTLSSYRWHSKPAAGFGGLRHVEWMIAHCFSSEQGTAWMLPHFDPFLLHPSGIWSQRPVTSQSDGLFAPECRRLLPCPSNLSLSERFSWLLVPIHDIIPRSVSTTTSSLLFSSLLFSSLLFSSPRHHKPRHHLFLLLLLPKFPIKSQIPQFRKPTKPTNQPNNTAQYSHRQPNYSCLAIMSDTHTHIKKHNDNKQQQQQHIHAVRVINWQSPLRQGGGKALLCSALLSRQLSS